MEGRNRSILIFVEKEYEDLELQYPKYRLIEAGFKVVVAGPEKGAIYIGKHGYPCQSDASFHDIKESSFDGLIIPGGYAPDKLRRNEKVLELTRQFHEKGKLIAFICHAGWVPISAKVINGIRCTSVSAIKDDLVNAGAKWSDEAVVVDRHFVSSRSPEDLPVFCKAILEGFKVLAS